MRSVSLRRQRQRRTLTGIEYQQMLIATDKPWCWFCGSVEMLERSHLMAGGGAAQRAEDRRMANLCCRKCHRTHQHHSPTADGLVITDANMLWIKQRRDPEYWDPEFLQSKWLKRLPDPSEPSDLYKSMYELATQLPWEGGYGW